MGPIGVKKHLIPFLPSHPYSDTYNDKSSGTIAAS
jgi:glycine cleavage system protein P-like pyridoxal-binding family